MTVSMASTFLTQYYEQKSRILAKMNQSVSNQPKPFIILEIKIIYKIITTDHNFKNLYVSYRGDLKILKHLCHK